MREQELRKKAMKVRSITLTIAVWFINTLPIFAVQANLNRVKRAFLFPPASGMGIFLALAVPLDLPQYEISLSYNFEANYALPDNATVLELGPQITQIRYARSLTRTKVYNVMEDRLDREGFTGKSCLLRAICETAAHPPGDHNGLIGDLVHLIFTPSSSEVENLPIEFYEAEEVGKKGSTESCLDAYSQCPMDLYSLLSVWHDE